MTQGSEPTPAARLRGGLPAGLDRGQIVRAARSLPPESLTMQAVANHLGVDRKALNYHVSSRDGLRELVAADLFATRFGKIDIPTDDWRNACTAFALGMAEALIETGELINYFVADMGTLRAIERVLETLQTAGFEDETAKRGLTLLTTVAMGNARDRVMAARLGEHPQRPEVRRMLAETLQGDQNEFPLMTGPDIDVDDESQLRASIDIVLLGLEQKLRG